MAQPRATVGNGEELAAFERLLPLDPQAGHPHSGQLEVVHLLHVAAHWLFDLAAVGAGVWVLALILAGLGWFFWAVGWLGRRVMPPRVSRSLDAG